MIFLEKEEFPAEVLYAHVGSMSGELAELLQLYQTEDIPGTVEAVRAVKAKALGEEENGALGRRDLPQK